MLTIVAQIGTMFRARIGNAIEFSVKIIVKVFFENPIENPMSQEEVEVCYRHHAAIDEGLGEFFFPE